MIDLCGVFDKSNPSANASVFLIGLEGRIEYAHATRDFADRPQTLDVLEYLKDSDRCFI